MNEIQELHRHEMDIPAKKATIYQTKNKMCYKINELERPHHGCNCENNRKYLPNADHKLRPLQQQQLPSVCLDHLLNLLHPETQQL